MPTKRQAQMEETRTKLIQAARKAFATKGYAASSMDDFTAEAGLTRGALYHNFGDKKGVLQAVIGQIDGELAERLRLARDPARSDWEALLDEGVGYIGMALEPEVQRIMLLDGPSVLGDPSQWPSQNACLQTTTQILRTLIAEGVVKPVDAEAAARLINGAAMNAALWIAAADEPKRVYDAAVEAFIALASGLLQVPGHGEGAGA
ncbi:TetR/AcrR family transcriptional regulator [Bacillus sp. NP157]|nr:TetR/AcrR family transcriptional regulator [Bacillus sp. NP157]